MFGAERFQEILLIFSGLSLVQISQIVRLEHLALPELNLLDNLLHPVCHEKVLPGRLFQHSRISKHLGDELVSDPLLRDRMLVEFLHQVSFDIIALHLSLHD